MNSTIAENSTENSDIIDNKFFSLMMILIYIVFIVVFETIARHSFKKSQESGSLQQYMIGVLFYACVGFCLIKAYQHEYKSMSMISVLWSALSVISILLVGYFYWGDDINYIEILGIILIIIGSVLVLYEYETEILTKNDEISLKRE